MSKSTAFTDSERDALGLTGLSPAGVDTEQTQAQRALQLIADKPTCLERHGYLCGAVMSGMARLHRHAPTLPAPPGLRQPRVSTAEHGTEAYHWSDGHALYAGPFPLSHRSTKKRG
jgi:hypothetical protein